jgi:hypothetical protein
LRSSVVLVVVEVVLGEEGGLTRDDAALEHVAGDHALVTGRALGSAVDPLEVDLPVLTEQIGAAVLADPDGTMLTNALLPLRRLDLASLGVGYVIEQRHRPVPI